MSGYQKSEEHSVATISSKEPSFCNGSEEYLEHNCDPCISVGDTIEAVGFCTNCDEYLCSNCFRSHYRSKLSKDHVLLDKDAIPSVNAQGTFTYTSDIGVKAAGDESDCLVTAMTMVSKTEMVMCDNYNKSVKLIDVENNVIKDVFRLEATPLGVTTISEGLVAVVLDYMCEIYILTTSRGLSVIRILSTNGKCLDVKYVKGLFYVSFYDPVKFQMIEPEGMIRKTINPNFEVLKHCTIPRYIEVHPDGSLIYVSDLATNSVLCIDMYGCLISIYQDKLSSPSVIAFSPFGTLYLCNREKHIVQSITIDLKQSTEILGSKDELSYPVALCFNEAKRHMYISSGYITTQFRNCIKVYRWN